MSYCVDKCGVTLYYGRLSVYVQGDEAWDLLDELEEASDFGQRQIISEYFD